MKEILNAFSDAVVLDSSHKTNRFNLPFLDVMVVNNMGKSTTCYFSLIERQTYENYTWALEAMKKQMNKYPSIILSDDEQALTKGILFILTLLHF